MLIFLSVDEILLPRYINWSTNCRSLTFNEDLESSWLKHMHSDFSEFVYRTIPLAAFSRLSSRDLAWAGVFAGSTRLSTSSVSIIISAGYHLLIAFFNMMLLSLKFHIMFSILWKFELWVFILFYISFYTGNIFWYCFALSCIENCKRFYSFSGIITFVQIFLAVLNMSCSSFLDGLWGGTT